MGKTVSDGRARLAAAKNAYRYLRRVQDETIECWFHHVIDCAACFVGTSLSAYDLGEPSLLALTFSRVQDAQCCLLGESSVHSNGSFRRQLETPYILYPRLLTTDVCAIHCVGLPRLTILTISLIHAFLHHHHLPITRLRSSIVDRWYQIRHSSRTLPSSSHLLRRCICVSYHYVSHSSNAVVVNQDLRQRGGGAMDTVHWSNTSLNADPCPKKPSVTPQHLAMRFYCSCKTLQESSAR